MRDREVLHETARRLRLAPAPDADAQALGAGLAQLPGVQAVRINATLPCIVVHHDGRVETRAAVLAVLRGRAPRPVRRKPVARQPAAQAAALAPALLALSVPVLPQDWRAGAALGLVATRLLSQTERLRSDPAAVLLDAASLASLAVSGQPMVVSTSVLLRLLAEYLSARLVRQTDTLMDHLLPIEAAQYTARREASDDSTWSSRPLRALRAGDRVRLLPGDVVPVDGCVVAGTAVLAPAAGRAHAHPLNPGDHLAAGERLSEGALELRAEAAASTSRLERMRAQVRHAIDSRDPAGRLTPSIDRLLSLPLTAAALVYGLTGDTARAASMLQADPQQGLDLAVPLAREAALLALARQGLLATGLEAIERLATARTLVLQDTGVLASAYWTLEAVLAEPGGDADRVRGWLAALADLPLELLDSASFSDRMVRSWVRHGAVLRVDQHEVHLASRQRLAQVWGVPAEAGLRPPASGSLRRELTLVAAGRVLARVVLASALRPDALPRLTELAELGFERIAVFVEADGGCGESPSPATWGDEPGLESIADDAGARADWLVDAGRAGEPLVIVHTVLRDLVPPGSLSLTPTDADAGSHGVLLGDPLASLVAARRLAHAVHRRLRLQQGAATAANATLMAAAALRWLPPIGTTLLHHLFALLLLLDSLRFEALAARPGDPAVASERPDKSPRRRTRGKTNRLRSEST